MRALAAAAALLLAAAIPLQAQNTPLPQPVGSIAVADSGLLTFASGSDYLVVATGQELELYDVRSDADPRDVVSFPIDSAPLALAATTDFALAALGDDSTDDSLLVIAPDRYNKGGFGIVNVLDVPKGTRQIALSPNKQWGLAAADTTYVTMALSAADDIQISAPFEAGETPIIGAALTNDTALLIFQHSTRVAVMPLNTSNQAKPRPNALTLDQPAVAITVSDDGQVGAIALEDNRLTLFDPSTLKVIRTVTLEDGPATDLRFLTSGSQRLLVLRIDQRPALMLLDVSQPSADSLPESLPVTDEARSLAASGAKLAVSDAEGVQLFRLGSPNS
jgi:hypothetical protein